MKCVDCRKLLNDFIDEDLRETDNHNVSQHIYECSECKKEAEALQRLSRDAASLSKSIQPGRDLWPRIEAAIIETLPSKSEWRISEGENHGHNWNRRKMTNRGWSIAAAVMIGLLLLAGTYLVLKKQTTYDSEHMLAVNAPKRNTSGDSQSISSPGSQSGASVKDKSDTTAHRDATVSKGRQPFGIITYPLEIEAQTFVSNYGIYAVGHDYGFYALGQVRDWNSLVINNLILSFIQNDTLSWIPPLPPGSLLNAVYPGSGNRLWIAYTFQEPEFRAVIAELDFGVNSEIRKVWESHDLYISRFAIGPQGLIYASGVRDDIRKTISNLAKGQSVSAKLLHIIDPKTGEVQDLFPLTLLPDFNLQLWAGETVLELTILMSNANIAVKSNGNYFFTMDQTELPDSIRDLIKNEAVEYFPDGTLARRWDLGSLEPDAYLNRIFVDVDDSILTEIIKYADSPNRTAVDRYLLRINPNGSVKRHELALYSNEVIRGWMGQTGELVTVVKEGRMQQITIRWFPF